MWSRRALATFYSGLAIFMIGVAFVTLRNRDATRRGTVTGNAHGIPTATPIPPPPAARIAPAALVPAARPDGISMPIAGLRPSDLRDSFAELHSGHPHEAIDILAPRGTPILAVDDGEIVKLFHSVPGGITIYQFNPDRTICYYYAHLERYAEGLAERGRVARGERIGYVGTSGNAPPQTPHLHFAVYALGPERHWWQGTAIDPYPLLLKAQPAP